MMTKIIRKPTRIEKTNKIMSEQVISWVMRVEVKRFSATNEDKEFDTVEKVNLGAKENKSTQNIQQQTTVHMHILWYNQQPLQMHSIWEKLNNVMGILPSLYDIN